MLEPWPKFGLIETMRLEIGVEVELNGESRGGVMSGDYLHSVRIRSFSSIRTINEHDFRCQLQDHRFRLTSRYLGRLRRRLRYKALFDIELRQIQDMERAYLRPPQDLRAA